VDVHREAAADRVLDARRGQTIAPRRGAVKPGSRYDAGRPRMNLADIDWTRWVPTDRSVLVFIVRGGEILLIRKKRGLGAGKINAPGGRIEPGESELEAALRETREEVGVTPRGLSRGGELLFQFTDGYALHCVPFLATGLEGEPIETEEAAPRWASLSALPFAEMWADDALWLPHLLAGRPFVGRFVFDGDVMRDHELAVLPR
jgi:8-oxo-dGTP diphosphatase